VYSLPHRAPKPEPVFRERIVVMRGLPVFKMHAMREIAWGIMKPVYLPCPACLSCPPGSHRSFPAVSDSKLERGRYLVEQVALCGDCHTPHNEKGEPIREKLLQGAPLPFKPTVPLPWADKAPNIAGLPAGKTKMR